MASHADPQPTFGLLWHSPNSSNYGVGALTAANIALLEQVAGEARLPATFEITGWSDPMPSYVESPTIRFRPFTRRFLTGRSGLAAMSSRALVALDIGGGDSFTDIYGAKRFWYQALSKLVVLRSGTPLILAPQTIGPFRTRWARHVARYLMRRCAAVVTRDGLSSDYVRALDRRIPLVEATDVAFALEAPRLARPDDGRVHVGINVSGLLFAGGYTRKNDFGLTADYPDLMHRLIAWFAARPECIVHLFSHVVVPLDYAGVVEDDLHAAKVLAARFGDNVVVEPTCGSPEETKAHIATMDFFCGSRMHACVAAFSSGVPTVPIAYSRKFLGLFGTLGYDCVADPVNESGDAVMARVTGAYENRAALTRQVAAANDEAHRRLEIYRDVVRTELMRLPARAPCRSVELAACDTALNAEATARPG
ncbi:MAG: hypothetical protein AcusKO_00370 [Acuticoccus sp.]